MVKRNTNSLHNNFKSVLKEAHRPLIKNIKNRYALELDDRLPEHLLSDITSELPTGESSLLLQLPNIISSSCQNSSVDMRNRS